MLLRSLAGAVLFGAAAMSAQAQATFDGYLCCNLRTDGSWASDSNYAESGKRIIPVGTPQVIYVFRSIKTNQIIYSLQELLDVRTHDETLLRTHPSPSHTDWR